MILVVFNYESHETKKIDKELIYKCDSVTLVSHGCEVNVTKE